MADEADRINLMTDIAVSDVYPLPQIVGGVATKASVDIIQLSSFSGTSWAVGLQYSLETGDDENWRTFVPAVTFDNTTPSRRNVSVVGAGHIRLITTTADSSADPEAKAVVRLY